MFNTLPTTKASQIAGVAIAIIGAVLLPQLAQAAEGEPKAQTDAISGEVGGGIAIAPDYMGSNDYRISPLAIGTVSWEDRSLTFDGTALSADLLSSKALEFGPIVNWTFKRDPKNIDSAAVKALGRIDDAFEVGAQAAVAIGGPLGNGDRLRFSLAAMRDVSDVHDGWLGDATIRWTIPVTGKLGASFEAAASYADAAYARTYFGVTDAAALASGLAAYRPDGGIKDVGATVGLRYAITDRWALVAEAGYRRLLGDFADSPIVQSEGSADQFHAGVGVVIGF